MTADVSIPDDALDAGRRSASDADVRAIFMLALGRAPESEEALAAFRDRPIGDLIHMFFGCEEFTRRIILPVASGKRLPVDPIAPTASFLAWAASRLPVSSDGAAGLVAAQSWDDVYVALLIDDVFRSALGDDAEILRTEIVETIQAGAALMGQIEAIDAGRLRGWALNTAAVERPLEVEVWINGSLVRAARADLFRRDIQDRFGGGGLAGFELQLPEGFDERFHNTVVEIRDRITGLTLAEANVLRQAPTPTAVAGLHAELAQIGALLKSIQARLPHVDTSLSMPLEAYGDYAEAWRSTSEVADQNAGADEAEQALGFVIDAGTAPARWLDDCVASLLAQQGGYRATIIVAPSSMIPFATDLANRAGWRGATINLVEANDVSIAERLLKGVEALPARVEAVVLLSAGDSLAPDAAAAFSAAFDEAKAPGALYADADVFAAEDANADVRIRRRDQPILRPAFDQDLLLQTPYTGQVAAFRRTVLSDLGLRPEAGGLCVSDALMRLAADAKASIGHIARVLVTGQAWLGPDSDLWKQCVEAVLPEQAGTVVEAHEDVLGAQVAGAVRVRRSAGAARATVIIPTRDALDMLKPCLDSLIAHRGDNQTAMDILVIDHASQEPETLAYLEGLVASNEIKVIPFEGEFNWALMNNLAAAKSDADVLVFLNNDTVVISPDWLDELTSQAMRPEVGVVGARLIYEDGTIQHAGFVTRDADYMFLVHEGVGRPGSDAGYLGRHSLLRSAAAVTGACIAVENSVFRALGGFDSANFPLEANDVDLCFRAQAGGLKVLYDPYVTLFHYESKTRGFSAHGVRRRIAIAASDLMWARWGAQFGQDPFYNAHFDRQSTPFTRLRPPRVLLV